MDVNRTPKKPILVVRPLRRGDKFLELLDRANIPFQHIPIMQIQPITPSEPEFRKIKSVIGTLDGFNQAIFISAYAAEIGLSLIDQYWLKPPIGTDFFAVGQQTRQIFDHYGYPVVCPNRQPNTEGLLQEIVQLQEMTGQSVVIFRGGEGRRTLAETLSARGAKVTYCNLYRRVIQSDKLADAVAALGGVSGVVVHSGELLRALGKPQRPTMPLAVPSRRVANLATHLGYTQVRIADNALPQSMYRVVKSLGETT